MSFIAQTSRQENSNWNCNCNCNCNSIWGKSLDNGRALELWTRTGTMRWSTAAGRCSKLTGSSWCRQSSAISTFWSCYKSQRQAKGRGQHAGVPLQIRANEGERESAQLWSGKSQKVKPQNIQEDQNGFKYKVGNNEVPAKCGRFSQREGCTNGSSERSGIVGSTQCVLASWLIKVIIKICLCLADWPSSILSRTYPGLRLNSSSSSTSFFYEFN